MLFMLYPRTPYYLNIVAGPVISYISIVMNIFIFFALFNKKMKSPSTVLMQGLAIADSLTALCTYGFEPFFTLSYQQINTIDDILFKKRIFKPFESLIILKYPFCVLHYCFAHLSDNFHLVSVLITASLGLQKLLSVVFPLRSRAAITVKRSVITCCVCFLLAIAIHIPRMIFVTFKSEKDDICTISPKYEGLRNYLLIYYPILYSVILTCAVVTMVVSTCFIVLILCKRRHIRGHTAISSHERKSCILISLVLVVFVLSEVPRLCMNTILFDTYRSREDSNIVFRTALEDAHQHGMLCKNQAEENIISRLSEKNITRNFSCEANFEMTISTNLASPVIKYLDEKAKQFMSEVTQKQSTVFGLAICNNLTHDKLTMRVFYELRICINSFPLSYGHLLTLTPYSEPMNYISNVIWRKNDITMDHLKIFIEIIKLSAITGCSSNFIIYVVMSEKLRNEIRRQRHVVKTSFLKCFKR